MSSFRKFMGFPFYLVAMIFNMLSFIFFSLSYVISNDFQTLKKLKDDTGEK